jgi:Vitamin K-dependent gamma-carboxylase
MLEALSRPRRLIGASLVRVGLGLIVLYHYVAYFPLREFLWGPNGEIPYGVFLQRLQELHDPVNLYAVSSAQWYFEAVFFTGLLVTALYTFGWKTRLTGVLMFFFTWSLLHRNDEILNGGHSMLLLILFYLMFADVGRYFSLDAKDEPQPAAAPAQRSLWSRLLGIMHNYAIAACVLQIMVMYLFSTLYKIQGHKWQDGTALYYILRSHQFSFPPFSQLIYDNIWLVVLGTYGTLLFQGALPWLVFHRKLKWLVLAAAVGFHASIAVLMGLLCFSAAIITVDGLLIDDASYADLWQRITAAWRRASAAFPKVAPWRRPAVALGARVTDD